MPLFPQPPRRNATHTAYSRFGLLRARLSRSMVLVGAVGMLAACGSNVPSVGEVETALVPATALPTLDTTPSVTLEPTTAIATPDADTTGTAATTPDTDTTGTPATGTTTTPDADTTGTATTPDADTTGTPATGTTTTPDADTTGTPATGTTTTPDADTTGTPATGTTTTPDADTTGTPVSGDASAIEASIAELMENPDAYLDRQVIVASTAQQIYDPIGVHLSDTATSSSADTMMLMVVGEEQLFTTAAEWLDESIETMGTLREFNQAEFEREFSWFDADAAWVAEVEAGQPILIADMIAPLNQ